MKEPVVVEIPALTSFVRMVFWYYVLKGAIYVIKGTVKYSIVLAFAAVAGIWVAWMLTSPPRPYGLDRIDRYLSPVANYFQNRSIAIEGFRAIELEENERLIQLPQR